MDVRAKLYAFHFFHNNAYRSQDGLGRLEKGDVVPAEQIFPRKEGEPKKGPLTAAQKSYKEERERALPGLAQAKEELKAAEEEEKTATKAVRETLRKIRELEDKRDFGEE